MDDEPHTYCTPGPQLRPATDLPSRLIRAGEVDRAVTGRSPTARAGPRPRTPWPCSCGSWNRRCATTSSTAIPPVSAAGSASTSASRISSATYAPRPTRLGRATDPRPRSGPPLADHYPGWGDLVIFAAATAAWIGKVSGCRAVDIDTKRWFWTVRRRDHHLARRAGGQGHQGQAPRRAPHPHGPALARTPRRPGHRTARQRLFAGPRRGRVSTAILRDATHAPTARGHRHRLRREGLHGNTTFDRRLMWLVRESERELNPHVSDLRSSDEKRNGRALPWSELDLVSEGGLAR